MQRCRIYFRGRCIAHDVLYCHGISRFLGLMFRRKPCTAVLVGSRPAFMSVHTLFVFFPLDVVWLSESFQVIEKCSWVTPFTLFLMPTKKAQYIVELPGGTSRDMLSGERIVIKKE